MQANTVQKVSGKRLWNKEVRVTWMQEDDQLRKIVSELGENIQWAVISQKFNERMGEVGRAVKRTNKQCRERQRCHNSSWQNHLNPALSNNAEWSLGEHHMLFTLLRQHSQQWSQISAKLREAGFGCRSDNHIKNYFYSSIKKAIKRINEILRNRNRLIKKQKSIMLNYNEKYAYQRHLSLQRQVQISSPLHCKSSTNVSNNAQSEDKLSMMGDLKIIKELDQEIVRKILLIAESKGAKKFTISYKKYEEDAINTRDRLIDFIQNDSAFQDEDIINLASQILELSKKCKRKSKKNQSLDDEICELQEEQREIRQTTHANEGSKKNLLAFIEEEQKYSAEAKQPNILQDRLLFEEQIIIGDYGHKKIKRIESEQNSRLKGENSDKAYASSKNLFLDQSNPYLFGSQCEYANQHGLPENQMINTDPLHGQTGKYQALLDLSQNILQFNQPYELPLELLKAQNVMKLRASSAQFEFLSSIKELHPSKIAHEHECLFGFDAHDEEGNLFFDSFNTNKQPTVERSKIFGQQCNAGEVPPSDPDLNKETNEERKQQLSNKNGPRSFLNRSWAYSSSLLEVYRIADSQNFDFLILRHKASAPL